jgi:hypothetical protein
VSDNTLALLVNNRIVHLNDAPYGLVMDNGVLTIEADLDPT